MRKFGPLIGPTAEITVSWTLGRVMCPTDWPTHQLCIVLIHLYIKECTVCRWIFSLGGPFNLIHRFKFCAWSLCDATKEKNEKFLYKTPASLSSSLSLYSLTKNQSPICVIVYLRNGKKTTVDIWNGELNNWQDGTGREKSYSSLSVLWCSCCCDTYPPLNTSPMIPWCDPDIDSAK